MKLRGRDRCRRAGRWLAGVALLGTTAGALAGVASLRNDAELFSLLSASPACCVVDARSEKARQAAVMPGALPYRDGLLLKPTSHAVVVADTDARAMAVARKVAAASEHEVYAAKGGLEAWRAVEARLQAHAARSGSKFSFVIPHNTCEQGKPLHVFKAEGPAPASSKAK
jgi:hypothetical protein